VIPFYTSCYVCSLDENRFPIPEAFAHRLSSFRLLSSIAAHADAALSNLPLELLCQITSHLPTCDVLSLLSTSNVLRATILPNIDHLAKEDLDLNYPWQLPYGKKELRSWDEEIKTVGGGGPSFPWFSYKRACERPSPSMLNRRRIWKILKQMEALAIEKGVSLNCSHGDKG
jgi:hypothetical protein